MDESAADLATLAGIHAREYIGVANGQLFIDALNRPADYVKWVIIVQDPAPDRVGAVLLTSPVFHSQYQLAQTFDAFQIYERQT